MPFKKTDLTKVKAAVAKRPARKPFFELIGNGYDAVINRPIKGEWEGFKFSQLKDDYEGRRLLLWISKAEWIEDEAVRELASEMLHG